MFSRISKPKLPVPIQLHDDLDDINLDDPEKAIELDVMRVSPHVISATTLSDLQKLLLHDVNDLISDLSKYSSSTPHDSRIKILIGLTTASVAILLAGITLFAVGLKAINDDNLRAKMIISGIATTILGLAFTITFSLLAYKREREQRSHSQNLNDILQIDDLAKFNQTITNLMFFYNNQMRHFPNQVTDQFYKVLQSLHSTDIAHVQFSLGELKTYLSDISFWKINSQTNTTPILCTPTAEAAQKKHKP